MWHEDLLAWHRATPAVITGPTLATGIFTAGAATVTLAGSGYAIGDVLMLIGGVHSQRASYTVVSVDGSTGVATVTLLDPGRYTGLIAGNWSTESQPPSAGIGCTLKAAFSQVPGGLVQLCQQDPSRVYLMLSVADGNTAWFAPSIMTDENQGLMVASFGCDGMMSFSVPRDSIMAKLAWYAWAIADAQPFFVVTATYPECPRPTWRDNQQARPVAGASTDWSSANGNKLPRPAAGKQSLLVPNWDDIGADSGA